MLYPPNLKARTGVLLVRRQRTGWREADAARALKARTVIFVLTLLAIVQWQGFSPVEAAPSKKDIVAAGTAKPAPARPAVEHKQLPPAVSEMRQTILEAVRTGRIEDLKLAIEWNELPPDFGAPAGQNPLEFLKKQSGDGEGREILAILGKLLELAPEQAPLGQDVENSAIYVWPYLAARPLDKLAPYEEVDLYRLMSPANAKAMREKKKWTWWTVVIGADGTWHSFRKSE